MKSKSFYRRWSFLILVITAASLAPVTGGALRSLRTNRNEVKEWLPAKYAETTDFTWFIKHFAGGQFVLLSWEGCTLDDPRLELLADKLVPPRTARKHDSGPHYFSRAVTGRQVLEELTKAPTNLPMAEAMDRLSKALIGPDGRTTCMVLTFNDEGEKSPRHTLEYITKVASSECTIPLDTIRMGGPPVDNVELDRAGENSLMRLAAFVGVIGVAVSWWCLRSFQLMIIVFFTGIYSAGVSLAMVWYSGGQMNSILLTMPSLVYVAAISGAIHLANYYRDTAVEHGLEGAPGRAIAHAWLPLVLAGGTTAFGLLSLSISDLVPIQLFGVYSAIGVVLATLILFFFLPAIFEQFPITLDDPHAVAQAAAAPKQHSNWSWLTDWVDSPRWRVVGELVLRHNMIVAGICLAIMIGCGWGITRIETSVKLLSFFRPQSNIVQGYVWLEENLGPLIPMEVVLRFDKKTCQLDMAGKLELIRRTQTKIRELNEVGSAMSAATFAPILTPPPKMPGVARILVRDARRVQRDVYNKRLEEHRQEFKSNGYMNEDKEEEVWRISARVSAVADIDYGLFMADIRNQVEPVLASAREQGVDGVKATYTGLVPLVYKSQRTLLVGLLQGFGMDLALIVVVLIVAVQDVGAGLLLLLPSIFPGVIVFGLLGWCGVVVDVGTVMPPSVALGVTVDDVVHFLLWFRRGLQQGMTRRQAVMLAYKDCARPMYQSWVVIGLGLSVFALSPFTPTQRFGFLMVTLLTVALAGNLLLLPALLASPLGWLFKPMLQLRNRRARLRGELPPEGFLPEPESLDPADVTDPGRIAVTFGLPAVEPGSPASTPAAGPHLGIRESGQPARRLRADTPHRP